MRNIILLVEGIQFIYFDFNLFRVSLETRLVHEETYGSYRVDPIGTDEREQEYEPHCMKKD